MNGRDRGHEDNPPSVSETADLAVRLDQALRRAELRGSASAQDVTRSTPEDLILGRLALETVRITPDRLREALLDQEQAAGRGEKRSLEEIFLSRNWLDAAAVASLKAPPMAPPMKAA